jgi:hypothetical protein
MLTNFRVGDRVEDKETHKRGRVTFVWRVYRGPVRRPRRSARCSDRQRSQSLNEAVMSAVRVILIAAAVCLAMPATAAITRGHAPVA